MKSNILTILFQSVFLIPFAGTQILFSDVTQQAGLTQTGLNYGIAVSDYNNDGLEDIFASRISGGSTVFRNMGDGTFQDFTSQAGINPSPSAQVGIWGDINNDGWVDLFIGARDEGNALYLNNQDGTFTDVSSQAGIVPGSKVKAALFADIDRDGWLDIYIARLGLENILYKNNGDGTFTNATLWTGATDPLISMGAIFFDYDNDGDPDLYLTHDANIPNILYRNNGNGQFSNVSAGSGANIAKMGMGVDAGDINNDGWLDLYITNLGPNTLLLNNGNGTFSDITVSAGVGDPGMGWGCSFLDFDNDGWQDIYLANDSNFSPFPNLLYRNNGDNTFTICSENSVLHSMLAGYGFASFDYDGNGKPDIYLANYGGNTGNQLFVNEMDNDNNWLKIKLRGIQSNAAAIGAKVQLFNEGSVQVDEVTAGCSWLSQNSPILHFGLGQTDTVELVIIQWPGGITDSFMQVSANQLLVIAEGESKISEPPLPQTEIKREKIEIMTMPNPFNHQLSVFLQNNTGQPTPLRLELTDLSGRTLQLLTDLPVLSGDAWFSVDSESLPSGIFLLKVTTDSALIIRKVVRY